MELVDKFHFVFFGIFRYSKHFLSSHFLIFEFWNLLNFPPIQIWAWNIGIFMLYHNNIVLTCYTISLRRNIIIFFSFKMTDLLKKKIILCVRLFDLNFSNDRFTKVLDRFTKKNPLFCSFFQITFFILMQLLLYPAKLFIIIIDVFWTGFCYLKVVGTLLPNFGRRFDRFTKVFLPIRH